MITKATVDVSEEWAWMLMHGGMEMIRRLPAADQRVFGMTIRAALTDPRIAETAAELYATALRGLGWTVTPPRRRATKKATKRTRRAS